MLRLEAGEQFSALAAELGVRRKLLYEWRKAWRRLGVAGLNRKRGPKPGGSRSAAPMTDRDPPGFGPLAQAQARIAELERLVGRQQVDLDFFAEPCGSRTRTARAAPRPHLRGHPGHDRARDARRCHCIFQRLCQIGGVSRAGYYRHLDAHPPARADADLRDMIQQLSLAYRHYGYGNISVSLN